MPRALVRLVWCRQGTAQTPAPSLITHQNGTGAGGREMISCGGYFAADNFGRGNFRHRCKYQSARTASRTHCLTHALRCLSPWISPGGNFAPCPEDGLPPRHHPPPPRYRAS